MKQPERVEKYRESGVTKSSNYLRMSPPKFGLSIVKKLKHPREKKMNKQNNQRRPLLLLAIIATLIVFGASTAAFAQKNLNAKFPKPDFSEMEEYWEIVSYEFDYTYANSQVPQIIVVAKKKQDKVLYRFDVDYYDADNVRVIPKGPLWFDAIAGGRNAKVGEPVRSEGIAPFMDKMKKVKKIVVTVSDAN